MIAIRVLGMAAIAALGGCDTPDLKVIYRVADGAFGQSCGTSECADIQMLCDSVLHVRVLSPADPTVPHISICQDVAPNADRDLCAIARIDLPRKTLPREVLEVQVTVWPRDAVVDPDTGELDCARVPVEFDATRGFPISGPAFGGRAFYYPDDTETVVTLGCTDVQSINAPTCSGVNNVEVKATVLDFENLPVSVSSQIGDRLTVLIGEPQPVGDGFVLNSGDAAHSAPLNRTAISPVPAWGDGVDLQLASSACIQVSEDGAQTTTALKCRSAMVTDRSLNVSGVRLAKATLDQILAALSLAQFPDAGLTVGIVVDQAGNPVAGASVATTAGGVQYLNATRTGLIASATSASGIFVSQDAPYGTTFSTFVAPESATVLAGRVTGKVTIAVLQFGSVVGGSPAP